MGGEPSQSEPMRDSQAQVDAAEVGEGEVLDALPVLSSRPRIAQVQASAEALPAKRRSPGALIPAVQAAAVAAGGFMAGAAVVGMVNRHHRRHAGSLARGRRARGDLSRGKAGRAAELVQIVGSRSLLVDVHLLGSGSDR